MVGRIGLCALAVIGMTIGAVQRTAAEVKEVFNRPGILEVGEPMLISRDGLRREMDRNSALKDYIETYGWPDYAEVQQMVVQEPLAPYEVRVYYLRRNQEFAFVRVNVAPSVVNFGVRKYEGAIAPRTIDRLLTARAVMEAQMAVPEPVAAAVPEEAAVAPAEPAAVPVEEVAPGEPEALPLEESAPSEGAAAPGGELISDVPLPD